MTGKTGVRTLICGGLLAGVFAATPAAAEEAPKSLRMRPAKRVSQAAPDAGAVQDDPAAVQPVEDAVAPAGEDAAVAPIVAPAPAALPPAPITAVPIAAPDSAPARVAPPPARFTVTGSLIERASIITPQPVVILTRDELLAAGRTMIGDVLQNQPAQGNAINAQANNGGDGSTRIDLRSLGTARTLTLLNGRRFVPVGTGADSSVDLNTIPLAVIDRVEILKDGASAVYGSDAIGGVVNIITRTTFTGTEASLYTGTSQRGDGFTYDASFITGHTSDSGRGNIIFSAGVQRQDPVFAGDREFSKFDKNFDFATRVEGIGGSTAIPGGRIDSFNIDTNGDGRPDRVNICGANVRFCTSDGRGGFRPFTAPADLYNYEPVNYLYTPSSRFNAYSAGTYKLTNDISGFYEMSYLHRESEQQLAPEPFASAATISRDSIFNPFGGDVFGYNRRLEEFGPRRTAQSIDTFRTVVGVRGTIPDDVGTLKNWQWELSYNYGRTDSLQKSTGNLILSHLQNALGPSFIDGSGTPTCGTPVSPIFGCVPMNILGPSGSISPEAVKYASFTGLNVGNSVQQVALASLHGRVARLPGGGDVSLALSADFHKESGELTPDPLIASGDTTGPLLPSVSGSTSAVEAAAELQIVALRDPDGLERAELDLAARAVRYDSFGAGVTSSARALVRPIPQLTLRANVGRSFRAPSVAELFTAQSDNFPFATDPCDHAFEVTGVRARGLNAAADECAREGVPPDAVFGTQQVRQIIGGNAGLQAETARTIAAGAVLEVPHARGLTVNADYWNVQVEGGVAVPNVNSIFHQCYDLGIQSACDKVHRDPQQGFAIAFVEGVLDNITTTTTSGVDVGVTLDRQAGKLGGLHVHAELQRLLEYKLSDGVTTQDGLGVYDLGVHPTMQAYLTASLHHPRGATVGFNVKAVGGFLECENNDCNGGSPSRDVDAYARVDLFGDFTFARHTTLSVGVNNVLDRDPSLIYIGFAGDSDSSTYDYLGRFFYARLTQQF
jgi:outer membrane receptor protein involved in Fe transport